MWLSAMSRRLTRPNGARQCCAKFGHDRYRKTDNEWADELGPSDVIFILDATTGSQVCWVTPPQRELTFGKDTRQPYSEFQTRGVIAENDMNSAFVLIYKYIAKCLAESIHIASQ